MSEAPKPPEAGSRSLTALLARLPKPAARLSYDLQARDLALTLAASTSSSAYDSPTPRGVALKAAASASSATGQLSARCSATKRLLLSDPHAAQPGAPPLTADVKVRATSGVDASLGLAVSTQRRVRLANGSALELKGGAVLDSQRMEASPCGHLRWRSPLWSVSSCQDLGLLVGLDYPAARRDGPTALAAAGGVAGLLQAAGNTARSHWPAGPPPILPLLLLPLHLLQRLRRAQRRRQAKAKATTGATEEGSRRVRFTDEAVAEGATADGATADNATADGAAAGGATDGGSNGTSTASKPKRRSRKADSSSSSSSAAAAEGGSRGDAPRSKRSSRGTSSGAPDAEQPSAPKPSPTRRSKQLPGDGERRKSRRPAKQQEEEQQQEQQRKGVPQWLKRLAPRLPRRLRRQAAALGGRIGGVAGQAGRVLGRAAAATDSVMGDLHVELTQLQYLPGSFIPYERMRLRYKHGQLRLIYDL